MKTLKNSIYKDIASVLCSDKPEFRTNQNIGIFSRIISIYPSPSEYCILINRVISFIEKNVNNIQLIIEIMKDEGEDEEIINNIELLNKNPTIKTQAEVNKLCVLLSDYLKYANVLKAKKSFLSSLDVIEDDDCPIKETVETLTKLSTQILNAYNVANVSSVSHTFDTSEKDGMKVVVEKMKDDMAPDKVIITGIRAMNSLLSPGYLSGGVYVYQGLPGNYKSGMLLKGHVDTLRYNEHLKNTTNGKTPISMYISMENTMTQTVKRLWSLLYPNSDITMFTVDETVDMIEKALTEKGMRSVILYYGYREKSTADIANIIRSYNTEESEVVALFFDYIKRVRPARTDAAATATEKSELNSIMNELKTIAAQFNIPIITGHQLNREAARAVDELYRNGGYNKTDKALGRSQTGSALNDGAIVA